MDCFAPLAMTAAFKRPASAVPRCHTPRTAYSPANTPPSSGRRRLKRDVPDQPRLTAIGGGQPVDADIHYGGARLDPVAAHHFRLADRGIDQIGARREFWQIARA